MPPSSYNASSSTSARQAPKSPNRVVAEAELQWLFNEAELANTPSVQDGMALSQEREFRAKGVNFIISVGILLKLPQLTLSTAAIFFQRFLMRASLLKPRNGIPKLHHYQSAATALFLATKVEESCRKMKELVQACCKVAQKNPNVIIDEQSKDFWKWRDCILDNEDILLETLCFDLTVESPHRQLFDMLKWYKVEHNKPVRNSAWAWVTDSNNTQLCLLCGSRAIAAAGLYAACVMHKLSLPDDRHDRPWWETQHVSQADLLKAINYMVDHHEEAAGVSNTNGSTKPANGGGNSDEAVHAVLKTPGISEQSGLEATRLQGSPRRDEPPRPGSVDSTTSAKRGHGEVDGDESSEAKRRKDDLQGTVPISADGRDNQASHGIKHVEEAARVQNGNEQSLADVRAEEAAEGSEEGEVEE